MAAAWPRWASDVDDVPAADGTDWLRHARRRCAAGATWTAGWPGRSCASCRRWRRCAGGRSASTATPRARRGRWLPSLAGAAGARRRGRRRRRAGACRSPCAAPGACAAGPVSIDASASSQFVSGLLLAGARFDDGADACGTSGEPRAEPAAHRDDGRDAAGRRRRGRRRRARHLAGRARPDRRAATSQVEPDLSNAAPFLAAAAVTGGRVTRARLAAAAPPRPGTHCATCSTRWAPTSASTASGLTVAGTGDLYGVDADLHDAGELTPVVAALAALADSPSHLRGHRPPARARDRPAGRARDASSTPSAATSRRPRTGWSSRPGRCTAASFATYDDHRMATAGACSGCGSRASRWRTSRRRPRRCPTSPACGTRMLAGGREPARDGPGTRRWPGTRPTRRRAGAAQPARVAAAHQGPAPARRRRARPVS